jgi:hypothetical protein
MDARRVKYLFFTASNAPPIDTPGQAAILRCQTFPALQRFAEIVLQKWRCILLHGVG